MGQFLVTSSSSSTTELEPSSTCPICIDDLPLPKGIELSKVVRIEVFNLGGRLMRALEVELVNGASIDVSDLPTGGYMMKMSDATGKTVAVQRFFKN